jgi:amidohydrolase
MVEVGKVAIRKGKFMASMDEISIRISGKGGHGAQPHLNIDPVMITAQILVALQQIVSRKANPAMPTVLSFGKIIADGAFNVIPNEVFVEGTFRTMDENWRAEAHTLMIKMATTMAEGMGGHCDITINRGYPFLINEEILTDEVRKYTEAYLGKENVMETDIWMAAEDFAYYSQETTACFYLLGIANQDKGITSSLHTPTFNIDENALAIGSGLMAYLAVKQLGN